MTVATERREQVVQELCEAELELVRTKGVEYAGTGDVLGNFRRVADRLQIPMETAWAVYFSKHVDAILSYCADPDPTRRLSEPIDGRIQDARVYLALLQLMVEESRAEAIDRRETCSDPNCHERATMVVANQADTNTGVRMYCGKHHDQLTADGRCTDTNRSGQRCQGDKGHDGAHTCSGGFWRESVVPRTIMETNIPARSN